MRYISTRGAAPALDFEGAMLAGLARDGGLYVPETWPRLSEDDLIAFAGLSYAELAARVMAPFLAGSRVDSAVLANLAREAYAGFGHRAVVPLKQLDRNFWLLELFHGPTLAFKDVALQLLGRLFDRVLTRRGERVTIVGATSGDTGSAAIEACRDRDAVDIFILYPHERVSEVQRRQMTTVEASNVHTIAIEGSFDDCQDLVKAMFNDMAFRDRHNLSAVNSINWARIMAQIVYYVAAAVALGAPRREIAFAVPTGNFGNIYSAYAARAMGLPIGQLVVGTNRNDILARFFDSAEMKISAVEPSLSPSMDIQVSSNFERLMFDLYDRDGAAVAAALGEFRKSGKLKMPDERWQRARAIFDGYRLDDEGTKTQIRETYEATGELLDPHSAVGVAAALRCWRDPAMPMVALAAAHPAKFPDAVEAATGIRPALPQRLANLLRRPELVNVTPNDLGQVQNFVARHARRKETT
ncbi:MAG: threonine synthase [Alphaproteobacteria bacterium]|nr:threonine synthase [Alphaproteobacteria bacterium]